MKKYRSKIGFGLASFLIIIIGAVMGLFIFLEAWLGLVVMLIVSAFVSHILLTTNYTIYGNELKIKSGFIYQQTINIENIKSIAATNNIISSPAASLDRLEVWFDKSSSVIISPKDKTGFLKEIKAINPNIEIRP